MNIDKMRPEDLHEEMLLLREMSGVSYYLKEKDSFIEVGCPGCHEQVDINYKFIKYGFKHNKCKKCNTLFVSPRPTEEGLFNYYNNYEAPQKWTELLIKTNSERKKIQHLPRVELLEKELKRANNNEKNLLVDVGAGNGNFAKVIEESNIFKNVVASDVSEECIVACKNQGLKTYHGDIAGLDDDSVDCFICNDLLEHLFDPKAFLLNSYQKLKNNGLLMISTPNGEGYDFKILKENTDNITPPEHLQYFNPVSIKALLEEVGFIIVSLSTPGVLDVEIIKRHIEKKQFNLKHSNTFLDYIYKLNKSEILEALQEFLKENLLSSHMLIFAKKVVYK